MWVPVLMFTFLGAGAGVIFLNYLGLMPGDTNNWYLLVGLAVDPARDHRGHSVSQTDQRGIRVTSRVRASYTDVTLPSLTHTLWTGSA